MGIFSFFMVFILFIDCIFSKELHLKENYVLKGKDNSISDLTYGYDDLAYNERFVRHVEFVTESVVEHLMKELKKKYPNSGQNKTSPILQRLRRKLQKHIKMKNRKLKKKHPVPASNGTNHE